MNKKDSFSLAFKHLKKDAVMAFLITKFQNEITLCDRYDYSSAKALSLLIIEQQVSFKAAITIKNRFEKLVNGLSDTEICNLKKDSIRAIGISEKKAECIKSTYFFFLNNNIDFTGMTNKDVANVLCEIKGIGEWTAQMFLIFILFRLDVFAPKDLALINSIKINYSLSNLDKKTLCSFQNNWAPYRTIASLLLWKSIETKVFYKN